MDWDYFYSQKAKTSKKSARQILIDQKHYWPVGNQFRNSKSADSL